MWLFITPYKGAPQYRLTVIARVPYACIIHKNSIFYLNLRQWTNRDLSYTPLNFVCLFFIHKRCLKSGQKCLDFRHAKMFLNLQHSCPEILIKHVFELKLFVPISDTSEIQTVWNQTASEIHPSSDFNHFLYSRLFLTTKYFG